MQLGPEDIEAGAAAAEIGDDVDIWYEGGQAGVVAMRNGTYVCWHCMDILVQHETHPRLRPVTISTGGPVGVYLHAKCASERVAPKVFMFARGMNVRRRVADIVKRTKGLFGGEEG